MNSKFNTIDMRVSQQTNTRYDHVIGFDLASSGLRCSHLRKDDREPINLRFGRHHDDNELPAVVFYKDWRRETESKVSVGFEAKERKLEQSDFCVTNVKGYIFDLLSNNQANGPSKEKVAVDFLAAALELIPSAITYFNRGASWPVNIDKCRYSFAIPDGFEYATEYAALIRYAFIMVGFLKADDNEEEDRLLFIHDAVAVGYTCLASSRKRSKVWPTQNYLACDIGYSSIKLSLINREATDAMSDIRSLGAMKIKASHRHKSRTTASAAVSKRTSQRSSLKRYFKDGFDSDNKSDTNISEAYGADQSTSMIANLIKRAYKENNIEAIYFCGEQCSKSPLVRKMMATKTYSDKIVIFENVHMVSIGATLFALKAKLNHIPFFESEVVSAKKTNIALEENEKSGPDGDLPPGNFVVGIDFGTTFSGASYADISNMMNRKQPTIKTICEWHENQSSLKMSAILTYGNLVKAIRNAQKNDLDEDAAIMSYYKHFLLDSPFTSYFKETRNIEPNRYVKCRYRKNHEIPTLDIITAHLKLLNEKVVETIASHENFDSKDLSLRYVIAVPVLFTRAARNLLVAAAIKAGLISQNQSDLIQFVTEPEATVLGCEHLARDCYSEISCVGRQPSAFIVCDFGGGAVDLSTFQRIANENTVHQMQQIGDSTSDIGVAARLNYNFRQYIERIDQRSYLKARTFYDTLEQYFNTVIKESFHPEHKNYVIPNLLHGRLFLKKSNNRQGLPLIIPAQELKECVFDPVLERVFALLSEHIEKFSNVSLGAALLVGGLAGCPYVQSEIKRFCKGKGINRVIVPTNHATVISEGAVAYCLDPCLIAARSLHVSYAIQTRTSNNENVSSMTYFAQQGTQLEAQDKISEILLSITYPATAVIGIFTTADIILAEASHFAMSTLPSLKNFQRMDELTIDLPPSSIRLGTKVLFKITFKLSIDGVVIIVKCLNEHLGLKELQYESTHSFSRFEKRKKGLHGHATTYEGLQQLDTTSGNDDNKRVSKFLSKLLFRKKT